MGCFEAAQGHGAVLMELSEVSPDVGKNSDLHQIAEVRAQVAELSAFIKGRRPRRYPEPMEYLYPNSRGQEFRW